MVVKDLAGEITIMGVCLGHQAICEVYGGMIAQVCGSSLWIWLAAVVGIGAWIMLIGILIACSIVSLLLIMFVAPGRPVAAHEEIHHHA